MQDILFNILDGRVSYAPLNYRFSTLIHIAWNRVCCRNPVRLLELLATQYEPGTTQSTACVLLSWGCYNKMSQTGWFKQQKFIFCCSSGGSEINVSLWGLQGQVCPIPLLTPRCSLACGWHSSWAFTLPFLYVSVSKFFLFMRIQSLDYS